MDSMNFACKDIGTTIYTNVVSADGFEIENLINSSKDEPELAYSILMPLGRKNGFMAEYFVKPPVDVVVQFPCLVDVDCLMVNCKSGSKAIANFDVSVANIRPVAAVKNNCESRKERRPNIPKEKAEYAEIKKTPLNFPCQFNPDISSTEVRKQNLMLLNMVGRFNSSNFPSHLAIFKNPKNLNGKGTKYQKQGLETTNFFSLKYLYGVSHLVIRVYRTVGSTVVAISSLEVWGKPSMINSPTVRDHIHGLLRQNSKHFQTTKGLKDGNNSPFKNIKTQDHETENCTSKKNHDFLQIDTKGEIIPEEFIDKITCNLMMLPVLLPSGHTIDASTLEKCAHHDKINGRAPSDPFTGIVFTDNNKAVPNASLKIRLDKFVLERNSNLESKCMGNTSGMGNFNDKTMERFTYGKRKNSGEHECVDKRLRGAEEDIVGRDRNRFPSGWGNSIDNSMPRISTSNRGRSNPKENTLRLNKDFCSKDSRFCQDVSKNGHEETLKDSLERALKRTITRIPALTKEKTNALEFCCCCHEESKKDIGFFRIPCNHIICRKCITAKEQRKCCGICQSVFSPHDVERVHFNHYFNC